MVGLILFGSGIALLSYVLEVFGEHRLGSGAILALLALAALLLAGYGLHAARTPHPLLRLTLFRIRTFRAAVGGSFVTRIGIGGVPFLLPLLYQVGLGYTPDAVGPADHAAGHRGDEPEAHHAATPGALRLSRGAGLQHRDARAPDHAVRDDRGRARPRR